VATTANHPPADPWLIGLTYSHQQRWWFTGDDEPEGWAVSADLADPDHTHQASHVGDLEIVLVDLECIRNPFDVLDVEDALLGRIAEILFDPATGQLDPLLDAQLEPLGSPCSSSRRPTHPGMAGLWLGVLLAGTAIKKLSGGVRFASWTHVGLARPCSRSAADRLPWGQRTSALSTPVAVLMLPP
jgi:hypothetical protein